MCAVMDWNAQDGDGPANYQGFLVPAMFAPLAERLVEAAGVQVGAHVLDVACGTGTLSRAAARRAGSGGEVTGVDLGAPMLAVAETQPVEEGAAPIRYLQGSAEDLPVEDAAFDIVMCQQGLQFFPDRTAALQAMRAACTDDGLVAVATWTDFENAVGFVALADALTRHVSEDAGSMMRSPFGLSDPAELRKLLERAGFTDVGLSQATLTARFSKRAAFALRAIKAGPVATVFAAAASADQDRVLADVEDALRNCPGGEELHFELTSNVAIARV